MCKCNHRSPCSGHILTYSARTQPRSPGHGLGSSTNTLSSSSVLPVSSVTIVTACVCFRPYQHCNKLEIRRIQYRNGYEFSMLDIGSSDQNLRHTKGRQEQVTVARIYAPTPRASYLSHARNPVYIDFNFPMAIML